MIKNSGYKMLLRGGETVYVEKGLDAVNYSKQRHGELVDPRSHNLKNHFQHTPWNLEGKALSALSRFGENARMVSERTWWSRFQHQQAIMEPQSKYLPHEIECNNSWDGSSHYEFTSLLNYYSTDG